MTTTPTSIPEEGLGGQRAFFYPVSNLLVQETPLARYLRMLKEETQYPTKEYTGIQSWVELGPSPDRTTPLPFASGEEYLRLLREAQRESNQSSARVSLASSHRASPKSPPNSPNTELCLEEDLKGVYINYSNKVRNNDGELVCDDRSTDWIWDWSSRPDQIPPKDWKFVHPRRKMLSIRTARVGKVGLFSREMMYTILLTNMLSLILGTGVGVWLSRRSYLIPSIKLD